MKKYLWLFLIPIILFGVTACTTKEKVEEITTKTIELSDSEFRMKTTFTYDKGENYTNIEYDEDREEGKELSFENRDFNLEFDMYYTDMRVDSYDSLQRSRSKQANYKEYKFGTYKAYTYGRSNDELEMNILLDTDRDDIAKVLFVKVEKMEDETNESVIELLESQVIQDFFNSIQMEYIS